MSLVEKLRQYNRWRRGEDWPDERGPDPIEIGKIIDEAANRIEALEAEVAHWKNNHETEVRRARVLKERTDMPLERVQAYEKWGEDQEKLRALEAHNAVLREALVVTHDLYAHASSGYGFARPDNPHNFSPDFECCSQEEIAAHSKACEDYDAGRKISNESWGIGTYCDEYAPALKALASTPESALADIRRAERERCAKMVRDCMFKIGQSSPYRTMVEELLAAIRQMED